MPIVFYIAAILLLIYGILISYYGSWWKDIPLFEPVLPLKSKPRITVIIPARNEENHISACLDSLVLQSYPPEMRQFIVVNDHSSDNTAAIIKGFSQSGVQLIDLADHVSGKHNSYKKKAIEVAISYAAGELIVTSDADCIFPPRWLETLGAFYVSRNAAFIAAPVRIKPERSLLSIFQSLDFLTLQGITGASVHHRFHAMCNGANMAYEKKAFYEVEGFKGIDSIASGDDMLLMDKIAGKFPNRVFYLKSPEVIVDSRPATNWRAFLNQRIRWASKADKYSDKRIQGVLLLVYLLNLLLFALLIAGCINPFWLLALLLLIGIKVMLELPFIRSTAGFFHLERSIIWFPFLQPLHIIYTVLAGFFGWIGTYEWKGRKVK